MTPCINRSEGVRFATRTGHPRNRELMRCEELHKLYTNSLHKRSKYVYNGSNGSHPEGAARAVETNSNATKLFEAKEF